jgi:DNA-binding CsgD family transcriptional regulator
MVRERGWRRGLDNLLRGKLARWLKSRKVGLHILISLLLVNLILFFTTTGVSEATQAGAAARVSLPKVGTELLYGVFVGVLVAFGAMIIVRGAIAGEGRSGTVARQATPLPMPGKRQAASQWTGERGLDAGTEPMDPNREHVLRARILLAQASLEQATRLLAHPLEAVETGERFGSAIETLGLQAQDEPVPAMAALQQALAESEPARSPKTQAAESELIEPLSERELEVLALLAEGLTNREIASRLYLALNTVKAHTHNIYGKLDVHSRTQAVAQARALGVLPLPIQETANQIHNSLSSE